MRIRRLLLLLTLLSLLAGCAPAGEEAASEAPTFSFADDFSADDDLWRTGDEHDEDGTIRRELAGGLYRVGITVKAPFSWYELPSAPVLDKFSLQADFRRIRSSSNESYGLVFCSSQAGSYYFLISPYGQFALKVWEDEADEWSTLIDWTKHGAIRAEGVNTLRVTKEGGTIELSVNDERLAYLEDQRLTPGLAGIGFSFYEGSNELEVEVDNFELRKL
jgi:hypothetical protein